MDSILSRIQAAQRSNPVLQKAADGGPITDQSKKTADVATDMITGATNIPDVTKDENTADFADIGHTGEKVVDDSITPAAPITANEDNPDVQEILETAETVIKTANAMLPMAQAFASLSLEDLDSLFNKQASAAETDEQVFDLLQKMASNGNGIAADFINYYAGCAYVMDKVANDAAALMEQGVPPEEAEAMAINALNEEMVPADIPAEAAEDAGADIEAAVAEITAEVAQEIMAENPETAPEEAQAMAEELVVGQLTEELSALEGDMTPGAEVPVEPETPVEPEMPMDGEMEQTASAEDMEGTDEPEVSDDIADEDIDQELEEALQEITVEAAAEIKELAPEVSDEEALELAEELVVDQMVSELTADMEEAGEVDTTDNEGELGDIEAALEELAMETVEEIMNENPEMGEEEAVELATDALADALATAQRQEAIGETDENGEYIVSDEDAAASIEEMMKSASANPLRGVLTPLVSTMFGIDPDAFINRIS